MWLLALATALVVVPSIGADPPAAATREEAVAATPELRYEIQEMRNGRVVEFERKDVADAWTLERGTARQVAEGSERIPLAVNELLTLRLPEEARRVGPDVAELVEALGGAGEQGIASQLGGRLSEHAPPSRGPGEMWTLPYRFVGLDAAADELELEAVVQVDGGGLRPQRSGGFLGRIFAQVLDRARPSEQRALPSAIEILVTAAVDSVDPQTIRLERTNQWSRVELSAASPDDPVVVRLVPTFDPEGTEIEVPLVRGSLRLSISPREIQGLGLETADVTVRAIGLPDPTGREVVLVADRGSPDEHRLLLSPEGTASTSIRSVTTGTAKVTVEASGMVPAEAAVDFVFPWLFLIATVVGGVAGALIRWARTAKTKRRNLLAEIFLVGVLTGLVVAVAYSVGINLLGWEPTARAGEALVFVFSALGAYFGLPSRG